MKTTIKMSLNVNPSHHFVHNFWSLLLSLLLIFITIISTQAEQRLHRQPDGHYYRLRAQSVTIPCEVLEREGECLWLSSGRILGKIAGKYNFDRSSKHGDCSLTINNLDHKTDDGEYQCQVTSVNVNRPPLISTIGKLVVLVPPSPPQIKNVVNYNQIDIQSDRNSEIECLSNNGSPAPRIEWFIDGENITQNSRSTEELESRDKTFKVTSVLSHTFKRSHRNSTITCQSVHQTVTQNTSAVINMLYEPQVSVPQKSYTVNEGDSLRVECLVDSNPPTDAVWSTPGNLDFGSENKGNILRIDKVTKHYNKAVFDCTARNSFGASPPQQIALDVLFEPTILRSSPTELTTQLGESVRMYCEFDGNPKPKIMWYHINPITNQVRGRDTEEEDSGVLIISNITYHDEGHYYCEALNHNSITNKESIARTQKIIVDVLGKPSVIQKKEVTNGYRGTDTDVEQLFCSDPRPTAVYWKFGSLRVDAKLDSSLPSETIHQNVTKLFRHIARPLKALDKNNAWPKTTCFRAILSILNTDISDERDYTLFVENQKGMAESVVKLKVNSPVSAAIMITIGLIILIMLLALTLVTLLVIKRRKLAKEKADDESKAEAREPMKSDIDKPEKEPEKTKENHELVYANLDFVKSEPKATKVKPTAHQRQHKTNGGNSGTEYAQIQFTNKADL